jgi:hypothetical protein
VTDIDPLAFFNRADAAYAKLATSNAGTDGVQLPGKVRRFFNNELPSFVTQVRQLAAENAALLQALDSLDQQARQFQPVLDAAVHWYITDQAMEQARTTDNGDSFGKASTAYAEATDQLSATVGDTTSSVCIHCGTARRRADLRLSHPIGLAEGATEDLVYIHLCRDLDSCGKAADGQVAG